MQSAKTFMSYGTLSTVGDAAAAIKKRFHLYCRRDQRFDQVTPRSLARLQTDNPDSAWPGVWVLKVRWPSEPGFDLSMSRRGQEGDR